MMQEFLKDAEYIYSSHIKWGLKRFTCHVKFYIEEDLSDLDFVICSILSSAQNGTYQKKNLGIMLGFSVVDNQPEQYYDPAEVKLFSDILKIVEEKHLIKVCDDTIELTNLGRLSLENNKSYKFYHGTQNIYEHLTFTYPYPTALLMFPFFKDMGICTELHKGTSYWPDDAEVQSIIGRKQDQLIKRLNLQSKEFHNLYEAEIEQYFDVEIRNIPVSLYQKDEEYIPIVYNEQEIAPLATKLFEFKENELQKENAILECLFKKLWDDKSVLLTFDNLEPYFELVDFEELTKNYRTQWNDERLLTKIVEMANRNCWINISNNCDLNVLYRHLNEYCENLDWDIVTSRADEDFIAQHFQDFPWDLEGISSDLSRDIKFIEGLIIEMGQCSNEWNWNALGPRLERDFVLSNLELVDVDLSTYTIDSPEIQQSILDHLSKRWDWGKIESTFDLSFILNNISKIESYLSYTRLFDRVFTDPEWANKYISDENFKAAVTRNNDEGGNLSSVLFNDKDYIWSDALIETFNQLNLIEWASTRYTLGFECNPYLKWDASFFTKYSKYVRNRYGLDYVSSHLLDESIINNFQQFDWNWSNLSANENITIDFIKANHTLPWDWGILTQRMFTSLKLHNIGHAAFINKWDWSYLSTNVPVDFIESNLAKFANHWDWSVALKRIISNDKKLDLSWLTTLASIIDKVTEKTLKLNIWSYLSAEYSYEELKHLIKSTKHNSIFSWDQNKLFEKEEFNVFVDIREFEDYLDWHALSCSKAFDLQLMYDHHSGIKEASWNKDVKQIITSYEDRWDYFGLSTFASLNSKDWFLEKYASLLDWEELSYNSKLFATSDKQQLNEIITKYKRYISFPTLCERDDVDIVQIMKIAPRASYDFNTLIATGQYRVTIDDIKNNPRYNWDWSLLSTINGLKISEDFLIEYYDKDWDWYALTQRNAEKLWSSTRLLNIMASTKKIYDQVDWMALTSRSYFPIDKELLLTIPDDKVNWDNISRSASVMSILPDLADYLNWQIVSKNEAFPVKEIDTLTEYADDLNWTTICSREDFIYTNEILERFTDRIDWSKASRAETIDFTTSIIDKYVELWDWPSLIKNKAFHNKIEFRDKGYFKQENIISFVQEFPVKPKAYHFTHMSNAIKIIKGQSLQSRNRAEGIFENSAGTNVSITAKAHNFARFYFTSKSPTQFYNECLGKDHSIKYYNQALELGLPKCPMPVFFIVDVEEVLAKYPEQCFYSNGNMQKSRTKAFKIIENPHNINATGIYDWRDKEARQQEFLVEDELDLSSLSSLQICCYDEYQCELLKRLVSLSPLRDRINARYDIYERINKELIFRDSDDIIEISTNYIDPFEFRIEYTKGNVPEILNSSNVLREKGNNIYAKDSIRIKKDRPFQIHFEVSEPRKGSWLIYTNK